ncbi:hypothetical protein F5884DRAFT_889825 [Xylogone sp. PMI_703]|nr:hypothetical protein F5884DRAFT_889825 [Xylogone sp. PMI_703]
MALVIFNPISIHRAFSNVRTLQVPNSPPQGHQIVDGNFQSYSIEFSYMLDFAGNHSHPNKFSYQMLKNLYDISGAYPIIRAGGTTQNRATFVENQTEALIAKFSASSPDQPSSLTIGPAWVESFQQFPKGTKYIYGLNFFDGQAGLNQTLLEAAAAYHGIGSDLYAFEIGNEVDGWPCGSRRPCNWTIESYVDQWLEFSSAIGKDVIGTSVDRRIEPLFQGCAFEAPRRIGDNETYWNVENAIKFGIASTGKAKTVSDHDYMGAACAGAAVPTIKDNLLNHFHMTSLMYYHEYLGNFSAEAGVPYVLGETNSISCQGLANISDVYAAALWSVDYTLYVSTLKVSRIYYHMGTPYRYSPWQPIAINSTAAHVKSLYYGNLFTSTALAGGNKQVSILVNETSFTAYGIYDASSHHSKSRLNSIALVNLEMWNSTQLAAKRPYTAVHLPKQFSKAQVRRLTSPGVEIAEGTTFAGQHIDENAKIVGKQVIERVEDRTVLVGAGEAVLVSL